MNGYDQIKKEVLAELKGKSMRDKIRALDILRPGPAYRFRYVYYLDIKDNVKKKLVEQALLDILNTDNLEYKIIKYRAAYVASDIGLVAAKPIVERLVMDKSLHGPCLLLIERAQEKFNISNNLSYEQIRELLITLIGEKYGSAYFLGGFPGGFKESYYNDLTNVEKKELIRKALMEILTDMSAYSQRHRCYAAYFASIIGLVEAKPIVERMVSDESITKNKDNAHTLQQTIRNFKELERK
jgi:hypothetical protein